MGDIQTWIDIFGQHPCRMLSEKNFYIYNQDRIDNRTLFLFDEPVLQEKGLTKGHVYLNGLSID